jgi:amino acid adenylation domain-containing protein
VTSPAALLETLSPGQRRALLARLLERRSAPPRPRSAPMSFAQERLWFLDRLQPGLPVYNIPAAFGLQSPVQTDALRWSLGEIVRRHEALRTVFRLEGESPVQVVLPSWDVQLPERELRGTSSELRESELRRITQEEARRPFDLTEGPLLRCTLVHQSASACLLLVTLHHIVADGWSMSLFQRELAVLYGAACQGHPSPLPELPIQYPDFARWQRDWLRGEELERLRAWWRTALEGSPALLNLPTDRPRPAVQTYAGRTLPFRLPRELADDLRRLAKGRGTTLFMVLLAALATLLQRHTGQDRINLGSPIAGRTRSELEPLIGLFVNTLVFAVDLAGDPAFRQLLEQVREMTLGAYAHQDLPFEKLVEELQPKRSLSHTALFQVMISLLNDPQALPLHGEAPVDGRQLDTGSAKFDLTLFLTESVGGLAGAVEFNTDLFDTASVQRLVERFQVLLAGTVRDPVLPLSALPLVPEGERQALLEWNDTASPLPALCLHELFEAQADRRPDDVALACGDRELTYAQVEGQANGLARTLRRLGVTAGCRVGLCLERSSQLVIALLGILKAGGTYVPLDPSYPRDRLAFMLGDSGAQTLVTCQALLAALPGSAARVLLVEELAGEETSERPASAATADDLAYVLYTSGSTGRPKGVAVPHRAVANTLGAMRIVCPLTPQDRVLLKTAISFDASAWECFAPLAAGARLVVAAPQAHRDPARLLDEIVRHKTTVLQAVPSMLWLLLQEPRLDEARSLRYVISGGEALPRELGERLEARLDARLVNVYGPTEAAINASWLTWGGEVPGAAVPIGRPLANMRLHLLDSHLAPLPIGIQGEIHLAGPGLAWGYLGRPDLTAESFLPDPFSAVPGCRLYRTGDAARLLSDGRVEFLGRLGAQVKLRGLRIELGEIEAVLTQHPRVRETAVLLREDAPGDPRLTAYVATVDGDSVDPAELRDCLRAQVPEHMIPAVFVPVPALPRTPSGKLDRAALPAPEASSRPATARYAPPRSSIEEMLAGIWSTLLRVDRIGVEENFFDLGGHSLLATQVLSRVRDRFRVEVPLQRFFEAPSIADLARVIHELEARGGPSAASRTIAPTARGAPSRIPAGAPTVPALTLALLEQRLRRQDPAEMEELLRTVEELPEDRVRAALAGSGERGFRTEGG